MTPPNLTSTLRALVAEAMDGPWYVDPAGQTGDIFAPPGVIIATADNHADADLIALAPTLAEKLAEAVEVLERIEAASGHLTDPQAKANIGYAARRFLASLTDLESA